tara:strand:- start:1533 stop:1769 length:237 start_codon:yes stop_codon:yes gene_type:complete
MECLISQYDNSDYEKGVNLEEFEKQVKKQIEKKEKCSVKPKDVFVGYKDNKNMSLTKKKPKVKGMKKIRFEKKIDVYQ